MLIQQRFLGASIVSFNGSIGWGQTASTLNVTLVEDKDNGDWFSPPPVGTPVAFVYSGWNFRGLLQSYKKSRGSGGELFEVALIDPRELLDGVNIITGGFAEPIAVPNILNVFGYLESISFGNSKRNSAGIPWELVRDSITDMTTSSTAFGGPISLRGYTYKVDLSNLPQLDSNYRIGGSDQLTLMGFISEICEAASHDFFIDLDANLVIRINTISRQSQPTPGALTTYINSVAPTLGIVSSEAGVEFRNETCNKYLVGANVREFVFKNTNLTNSGIPRNKDVWPFWGFDSGDQVIIGDGINDDHKFTVDARSLREPIIGDEYQLDVAEVRSASVSMDAWETLLKSRDKNSNTPQYRRASKLNIVGIIDTNISGIPIPSNMNVTDSGSLLYLRDAMESDIQERTQKIYNFVRQYSDNYYGKRFIMSVPDIKLYKEPDEYKYRLNYNPVNGGFIDSPQWSGALANNLIPPEIYRFMNEDGTFPPYARYDNTDLLDLSEVPDDQVLWNTTKTSAFIKMEVNEGLGFEYVQYNGAFNTPDYSGARAVVTLPGIVRFSKNPGGLVNVNGTNVYTDLGRITKAIISDGIKNSSIPPRLSGVLLNSFGVDTVYLGDLGASLMPSMIAVPFKDNLNRYGPWYMTGANGKTEFEVDENLAPWNYGGYDVLDTVARARVTDGVSQQQQAEAGSIEIPGIPAFTMGQQLVANGPYITDIDVSIGQQGVTSIYRFSTWSPQFGQLKKAYVDRINRLTQQQVDLRNVVKGKAESLRQDAPSNVENRSFLKKRVENMKRLGGLTSHGMISGEGVIANPSSIVPNCWVQPIYNFTTQIGNEYDRKAGVSIDGLFRPFTTNVNATGIGMPHFVTPIGSAVFPTVNDLNPYKDNHDINIVVRGSSIPTDLSIQKDPNYSGETDYRSLALRGPIIVAGWGLDTEGKPVPNESGYPVNSGERTDNFAPNYRQRQDWWPAGPLDIRWSHDRGVWEAGGTNVKVVQISSKSGESFPTEFGKVYYAQEIGIDFNSSINSNVRCSGTGKHLYVGNFRQNVVLESSIYVAFQINGKYYLDNQSVFNFIG